jgi:hypothetical protein
MALHVLCPCCGTEIAVPENDIATTNIKTPTDGTFFLVPKNNTNGKSMSDALFQFMKNNNISMPTGSNPSGDYDDSPDYEHDDYDYDDDDDYGNTHYSTYSPRSSTSYDENKDLFDKTDFWKDRKNQTVEKENVEILRRITDRYIEDKDKADIRNQYIDNNLEHYIDNKHLNRRWILAQTLRAFYNGRENGLGDIDNYTQMYIRNTPYRYQWETTAEEFRRMGAMTHDGDIEIYRREKFYNKDVLLKMLADYQKHIKGALQHKLDASHRFVYSKNKPRDKYGDRHITFVTLNIRDRDCKQKFGAQHIRVVSNKDFKYLTDKQKNKYVYVRIADVITSVMNKVQEFIDIVNKCNMALLDSYYIFCDICYQMTKTMPMMDVRSTIKKSTAWANAFKGTGAYYSLENLIKYHNCHLYYIDGDDEIEVDTVKESLQRLDDLLVEYKDNYYKLFAVLKYTIVKNGLEDKIRNNELW